MHCCWAAGQQAGGLIGRQAMEELLEVPMGLAAGSTVNLKSRTGGTISFSMPEMGVGGAGAGAEAESATAALSPMDRAAALKAEGNELFGAMEWVLASKAYLQATRVLAKDRSGAAAELLGACWLNLGACHLRLEQPAEAVEACDQSLAQRRSAKGLYRRALARQLLAAQEGPDAGSTLALAVADAAAAVALGDTKDAATRQLVVDLRAAAALRLTLLGLLGLLLSLGGGGGLGLGGLLLGELLRRLLRSLCLVGSHGDRV